LNANLVVRYNVIWARVLQIIDKRVLRIAVLYRYNCIKMATSGDGGVGENHSGDPVTAGGQDDDVRMSDRNENNDEVSLGDMRLIRRNE
jgi:hypothetical protein